MPRLAYLQRWLSRKGELPDVGVVKAAPEVSDGNEQMIVAVDAPTEHVDLINDGGTLQREPVHWLRSVVRDRNRERYDVARLQVAAGLSRQRYSEIRGNEDRAR